MSATVENVTEVLNAVRIYFDGDLGWAVGIDALSVWLETQNITIIGKELIKLLNEHADEFEVSTGGVRLKKVVTRSTKATLAGSGSYIKDMIELQRGEFLINDVNNSIIQEDTFASVNEDSSSAREDSSIKDHSSIKDDSSVNDDSSANTPTLKHASLPTFTSPSQPVTIQDELIEKQTASQNAALECAKKYLDLCSVESIYELEKHMKLLGVINDSEFQDFLRDNKGAFQIFSERGITCISLSNQSIKPTETMLKRRITQTERLINEYLTRHGGNEGVTSTELNIYLRGTQDSITDELVEFIKTCKDSFECISKDDMYYIKLIPQSQKSPNTYRNKHNSPKTPTIQLIRELLVRQIIASLSDIKEYLKERSALPTINLGEFVYSHTNDLKLRRLQGELYIRLKPTDANIVSYLRKFLLEHGKVRLSVMGDFLKRQDMYPRNNRLKEFLLPFTEFKLSVETDVYIRSQDIDIARLIRQFLKPKGDVPISMISDHLNAKNMHPHGKLVEFLENYSEFMLSQGQSEILVKYNSALNEISPKDFIRKYILFEGGKVPLFHLVAQLNWNNTFPEFKLVELINNSKEFAFQRSGNEAQPFVTINQGRKPSISSVDKCEDKIELSDSTLSPEITPIKTNPNVRIFEDRVKTIVDTNTKPTEFDNSLKPYIFSSESDRSSSTQSDHTPLIKPKFQSINTSQSGSTTPQSDVLSPIHAQSEKISRSETPLMPNEQISKPSQPKPSIPIQTNEFDNQLREIQELIVRDDSQNEKLVHQNHLFRLSLLEKDCSHFKNYISLGILETNPNEIVYLNGDDPFSMIISGLPNSGVSQTKNTILEGCLIKNTRLGKLDSPYSALIFRFDNSIMTLPCDSALLATSAKHSGVFDQETRAEKVVVLVTLSNYQNMVKLYANFENCEIIPLLFSEKDLCRNDIKSWVDIVGDSQIHEQAKELVEDILYFHMDDKFNYDDFCVRLYDGCKDNHRMRSFFSTRLGKLDTFIVDKLKESLQNKNFFDSFIPLEEMFRSGVAIVVDLSDSLLGAKMASELFNIILGVYTRSNLKSNLNNGTEYNVRKLVVLDEAHKYLVPNTSLATTVHHLQSYPQHHKVNLIVTTYEPTSTPLPILLQSNMLLLHHFSSPLWSQFLSEHVPFPEGNSMKLLRKVVRLKMGRMIIFCPHDEDDENDLTDESNYSKLQSNGNGLAVILRKRITST
ncbi:16704_t:CDS:2 [Funneliformis geosporum]|uniref:527_t:CDS:1 n=1 Tax=Funneliformis geosporum TaxID=1117311 RepID=A0A9W4SFX5_9GLOM|nr:16704_t:CDS:2 [Funneliformis geosporum]CAI2166971.1 527_t:CDS:2 [Funneliformis geosporum]